VAGDQDVAVMGGGVATAALRAGLLNEVILHQVPCSSGQAAASSASYLTTSG
jgi:hypothetical protein